MRVLIDTSYVARGRSGTAVYVDRLVDALRREGTVEVVEARQRRRFRPGRSGRAWNPLRSAANAFLDLAWLHIGLPRAARLAGADVVHHPLPAHSRRIPCAQVATVHDVAFERLPRAYGWLWRLYARRQYRRASRLSDAIVSVSEATVRDVVDLLAADRSRIVVAHHGPGQALPALEREPEPRHFLYVGDAERRKEVFPLVFLFWVGLGTKEGMLPLVLAGSSSRLADGEHVQAEPNPSPERLAELLAGAAALVHPALYEGFGLTLVEAMAAGVPVVARRTPPTEEVCGDAALLFDGLSFKEPLERVARDPELRKRLSAAGRERAARFSWEESARRHLTAYTLALETRARAGGPG
jgi:glycosyltransferase involved in cell wall biosynthesis